MRKVGIIARRELLYTLTRKTFLFMTFIFPAVILGIVGISVIVSVRGFQGSADITRVGLVDPTGLMLRTPQGAMEVTRFGTEPAARRALLDGSVQEYYVIPADYLAMGAIVRYTTRRSLAAAEVVREGFLRDLALANLLPQDTSKDVAERIKSPVALVSLKVDPTGQVEEPVNEVSQFLVPYFSAMLLLLSIFITSGFLLQGVSEEKEYRIMEVLLSAVTPGQLLLGKVLGLGLAGLFQIAVWLGAAWVGLRVGAVNVEFLRQVELPAGTLALSMAYFLLGYLFFATVMAGLGAVAATQREGQQIAGVFSFLAASTVILMTVLVESPDSALAVAMTLVPFTAPMAGILRFASGDIVAWQVAASLAILGGSTLVALWASSKVFRAYLLMYGRRPGLREIWTSLRAA